jgi:hypothetical protein
LVGSVYLADNLSFISLLPKIQHKTQIKKTRKNLKQKIPTGPLSNNNNNNSEATNFTSDDLTDITSSILPQQKEVTKPEQSSQLDGQTSSFGVSEINSNNNNNNNNDFDQNSAASTLDISSFDEQEEMLIRKLQETGSRSKTPSPTKQRVTVMDEYSNFTNITETKIDTSRHADDFFKQSPRKTPHFFDTKQFSVQQQPEYYQPAPMVPAYYAQSPQQMSGNPPIADIIRDELKKIVQLQHDTIMNVLNGNGMPQPHYPVKQMNGLNMESNLIEQLKYVSNMNNNNGEPIEFIIETKVKTSQNGPVNLDLQNNKTFNGNENKSYFMKTFDSSKKDFQNRDRSPDTAKKNILGIPLLSVSSNKEKHYQDKQNKAPSLPLIKEGWGSSKQNTEIHKTKVNFNFPLLTIKSRKDRSESPKKYDHSLTPYHAKEKQPENVEDTLKVLKNLTTKPTQQVHQNIRLLQLNTKTRQDEQEVSKTPRTKTPRVEETQVDFTPTRETPVKTESKSVEAMQPLYDGYILKPGIFDELMPKEKVDVSSAYAHYHATEHLREQQQPIEKPKKGKDIFTMTDNLANANAVAPDILFKLKFDPLKKGRETNSNNIELEKDFVNVADLNSDAVQEMLRLIEREQNKRTETYINSKAKIPKPTFVVKETVKEVKEIEIDKELQLKPDTLTEKLLKDEEQLDYDLLHQNLISSHARSKSRQTVLDEFKLMDQKIKIMNDIAGGIGNDFLKYNKMVDTIQDYSKIADMTHEYPIGSKDIPRIEEILKIEQQEKEDVRKKPKFYKKKDADKNIEEFKEAITRPPIKRPQPKEELTLQLDEDEELSDLKADEEDRLKKILNIESNLSLSNLMKDSFDETEPIKLEPKKSPIVPKKVLDTKPQLSTRQQLELEQRKQKNKERMDAAKKRRDSVIATVSCKSPTRRDVKTSTINITQPSPRLNVTYKVPTSNLVQLEKEKAEKRETMHNQFMEARAYEAQMFMKDIINDNLKTNNQESTSMMLDLRSIQTKEPDDQKKAKKIDLMTRTILQLQKEEEKKRAESNILLHEFEKRARDPIPSPERTKPKTVKSFTHYVHLQEPDKLKHNPVNPPVTYSERLQQQQEETLTIKQSENEVYKIYGTKRVPGLYKSYVKQTPRKVKTYQERVRDLRPENSTIYIDKQPTRIPVRIPKKRTGTEIRKGKTYAEQLKELQNQTNKTHIINTPFKKQPQKIVATKRQPKSQVVYKNRFTPYTSPYIEAPDELSPWSIDDNMKRILYDQNNMKKRVSYKEQDQETLADTDDYLQIFYDESNQKDIDNERDYTESVHIDDLMNLVSLSTETVSYVDWDQVERILNE